MFNSSPTVIQKFWTRVFVSPDTAALLVANDEKVPFVYAVPGFAGIHGSIVVIPPKPFVEIPFANAGRAVATICAFLRQRGFKKGDRAAILAWNCPEWAIADWAIQSLGGIVVPVYPHSTPEQVNYVLKDSGASFLFSNDSTQLAKADASVSVCAVHFDDIPSKIEASIIDRMPFVSRFTRGFDTPSSPANWSSVEAEIDHLRQALSEQSGLGITGDDIVTIIYTSGSTGVPKGAILTHGNFASACQSLLAHGFELSPDKGDVYLSYLPLAHVYERVAGLTLCTWTGVPMAFCKVDEVGETLKLVRPTALHGVPAVWRKVKDKILGQLQKATGIKGRLVRWALSQRNPGFARWLADKLVFSKIRAELGGKLRIMTSGGAPIAPEILEFYQLIGLEILQGYGLTETCGANAVNRPSAKSLRQSQREPAATNKVGSVGQLIPDMEVRIVKDAGQDESPAGEIWFRGPLVFKGYWNLPEETAKTLTADGWFKTGDLGRIDEQGFLFITGRKKRLLKTDGGKYVAPEKIEKAFEGDPIVQYVVPVGDGKPFISALIFVNQQAARELLEKIKAGAPDEGADLAVFYAGNEAVARAVGAAVEAANFKLERWEQLKKFQIVPVEASIAGGLLTPTLKIRTEEVIKRYAALVESFYRKAAA